MLGPAVQERQELGDGKTQHNEVLGLNPAQVQDVGPRTEIESIFQSSSFSFQSLEPGRSNTGWSSHHPTETLRLAINSSPPWSITPTPLTWRRHITAKASMAGRVGPTVTSAAGVGWGTVRTAAESSWESPRLGRDVSPETSPRCSGAICY